jgi:hypothetical protein
MNPAPVTIPEPSAPQTSQPNPWLAAALSFFLPGAGQAFHGRLWKGIWLLTLSFVALPVLSLSLVHLRGYITAIIILFLFIPWVYSIADAAREANRLESMGARLDARKGAIYVSVLLVVVFPLIATVFSTLTLLLLPTDVLIRINDWSERFRSAIGLE